MVLRQRKVICVMIDNVLFFTCSGNTRCGSVFCVLSFAFILSGIVVACAGDEVKVVSTPPFAESVTEGDVKWIKGKTVCLLCIILSVVSK